MKLFLIALTFLLVSFTAGHAAAGGFSHTSNAFAANPGFHRDVIQKMMVASADAQFAQLETPSHTPVSSSLILTLVVVFVFALRLMGLNHARAMADHERNTYHGKAQMFRSLHDERSGRR
jgi:hypothetical protein